MRGGGARVAAGRWLWGGGPEVRGAETGRVSVRLPDP